MRTADIQNFTRRFWHGDPTAGDFLDIVDFDGIVTMSGFTTKSVRVFAGRDDFPSPVARTGRKLFWRKGDIERWIRIKKGEGC